MEMRRRAGNAVFALAALTSVAYLVWRALFTIPFSLGFLPGLLGIFLYISELTSSLGTYELYWRKAHNHKVDLTLPVIPDSWFPHVDILIATHNEPADVLYKTVNACKNFDYPDKRKVHIYFCDDSNRLEVARLAEYFGVGYFGLTGNKGAKSGNFNNALAQTSSPLIATFDADMIGQHTFLTETVPYFFLPYFKRVKGGWERRTADEIDPAYKIGLIQTPQSFYNPDLFQFNLYAENNIPNEQDFFSREINQMRNSDNAIAYTGSNTLISRQALADIGYFPTDTITEDFETGLLIQSKGYTCYATDKVQASGLSTTSVKSMITQRIRWARGVIQSVRNCRVPFNKDLTFSAKCSYMACFSYWWSFARRLMFTMAPILFALFDLQVVTCTFEGLAMFWLPQYVFYCAAQLLLSSKLRNQRWNQIVDTVFAPYMVFPVLLETIGISQKKFKVTDKKKNKSDDSRWRYAIPQFLLLGLSVAALIRFCTGKSGMALLYGVLIIFWLVYNIINLLYALFFMLGRPAYRASERFAAQLPLRLVFAGRSVNAVTENLSEGGLSFVLNVPVYIPTPPPPAGGTGEYLHAWLSDERYSAQMTLRLLYVNSQPGRYCYHCAIADMDSPNWNQYLQMVYDRVHPLPQKLNTWVAAYDDIINNIHQRMRGARQERRATPRIEINRPVVFREGLSCQVIDFNYVSMRIGGLASEQLPATLTLDLPCGLCMHCRPSGRRKGRNGEALLTVTNWQELAYHPDFLRWLIHWPEQRPSDPNGEED